MHGGISVVRNWEMFVKNHEFDWKNVGSTLIWFNMAWVGQTYRESRAVLNLLNY
jgi:hypothetical protein